MPFLPINAIAIGARRRGVSKPAAPQSLAASVVDEVSIGLTWDAVTGADSYKIYYGTDGVTFGSSTTSATNSKTVDSLTADTTYYFYVVAVKGTTEGTASATASAKTYNYFITSVVTTGAATLTLLRIDIAAGQSITIDWGDGSDDTYTDAGNNATKTHAYAGAGTWAVKISGARYFTIIYFNDSKLRFNSSAFLTCGNNLTRISLETLISSVINTSDMSHLRLTSGCYFFFTSAGTYTINSLHLKDYLVTDMSLTFTQVGTYIINTSHFKDYPISASYFLRFTQAGTYTVARADFAGIKSTSGFRVSLGLVSADVDKILLGLYDAFPSKTNTGGTIDVTGNQAPTGTYQAKVPPTTGKEAAYELLNDSGGVSSLHWATITVEGGGTP